MCVLFFYFVLQLKCKELRRKGKGDHGRVFILFLYFLQLKCKGLRRSGRLCVWQ